MLGAVIAIVASFVAIFYFYGGGMEVQTQNTIQDINDQVARDAVQQYNIAVSSGGTDIDVCIQAGLVSAAYLQAQDSVNYQKWKQTEARDCEKAGIPR